MAELILSLVCLATGYGIFTAFGGEGNLLDKDPDTLMLIGITAFAAVGGLIAGAIALFKRLGRARIADKKDEPCGEEKGNDTE